jgi:SAM-dependent methyltransferase
MCSSEAGTLESAGLETTACPLCGQNQPKHCRSGRDLLYGQPGEFHLVRCGGCGHVYLNPRPTRDAIGAYYPPDYAPFRLGRATTSTGGRGRGRLRRIRGLRRFVAWFVDSQAEFIPPIDASRDRALEIGCADGRFLDKLRAAGWQSRGVEPSPAAAEAARSRGFDVHTGTLESADFGDGEFDAVFAWMVVEHLHDPVATLAEVRRVLKPSGWLCLCVPNFGCWEPRVFGRYWYALQLPTHLQHFTPRTLRRLLEGAGFEVTRIVHQRNLNNVVGSAGLWLRERFPRRRLGERLIRFTDDPSTLGVLLLAIPAKVLAWLGQGGRLTVVARRR